MKAILNFVVSVAWLKKDLSKRLVCRAAGPRVEVLVITSWSISQPEIEDTLSTQFGACTIADYIGGPTRQKSRCRAIFNSSDSAAAAVACDDLEIQGRRCTMQPRLTFDLRRSRSCGEDTSMLKRPRRRHSPEGSWREYQARAILERATSDNRGPGSFPPAKDMPSASEVIAALEALDNDDLLSCPFSASANQLASMAVTALAAVGESRRALALLASFDHLNPVNYPMIAAKIYALCANRQYSDALDLYHDTDDRLLDLSGFNAALNAAERLSDYDSAYAILQARSKRISSLNNKIAFQKDLLNAKRRWLADSSSSEE